MITVDSLSFTYKSAAVPAVSDLSFEVRPSEIFGCLGPSGAGKSTTQKILIGLLQRLQRPGDGDGSAA
jgi:fluoroquinolone transport system ATP-binding protein